MQCGIIIKKYLKKVKIAENYAEFYDNTIRQIIESYRDKLENQNFYFAPDIPEELLQNALSLYATEKIYLHEDDVLLLGLEVKSFLTIQKMFP